MEFLATTMAEALAEALWQSGCRRVYGLPGEDHLELLDAMARRGIRYVGAYNESSAVLMASAEAQACGSYGVALVSMSAGMSNAINGLTHAFMEQVPVLVISGQHPGARYPFIIRQGFDIASLAKPVTKWQVQTTAGTDVSQILAKALNIAFEHPRGPIYIEFPAEIAGTKAGTIDDRWLNDTIEGFRQTSASHSGDLVEEDVSCILNQIETAKHPILIVGGREHVLESGEIDAFASNWRIPVFVTCNQKGVLAPKSDYFAGVFLNANLERRLIDRADLILAVNLEGFDLYSKKWSIAAETVSITSRRITETFVPAERTFIANPASLMQRLAGQENKRGKSQWLVSDIRAYRENLISELSALDNLEGSLTTSKTMKVLEGIIPSDTIVVADAGFSKPIIAYLWESSVSRSFYASNALGTMGHALPSATALKLAEPDRLIVAFMGDGSLLMRMSELRAAADAGVNPIIFAFMDSAYTQIAVKQERRSTDLVGVQLPEISANLLAEVLGCNGADVFSEIELRDAVKQALTNNKPSLIGVHISNSNAKAVFELLRG